MPTEQQWWASGNAISCARASRARVATRSGDNSRRANSRSSRCVHALAKLERHPAVVSEVRGIAEARIHFERALALDAHPELRRESLAVVVQHRECCVCRRATTTEPICVPSSVSGSAVQILRISRDGLLRPRRLQSIDLLRLHLHRGRGHRRRLRRRAPRASPASCSRRPCARARTRASRKSPGSARRRSSRSGPRTAA